MTTEPRAGPIAMIAGSGSLPHLVSESLTRRGCDHRILALRGFAEGQLSRRADAVSDVLDISGIIAHLARWRPSAVTMAGGLRRPSPTALMGALSALRNRAEIARLLSQGDDGLLRGVIALLQDQGHRLVGIHELAPELLAQPGQRTGLAPTPVEALSIETGLRLLSDLSPYDVGQAAVLVEQRVVAIEGPEGTDRMIVRAGHVLRPPRQGLFRGRRRRAGLLVKGPKRGQEFRVDLPAIGPMTIVRAAEVGLAGVAIVAGATLILDQAETLRQAEARGLFLVVVREHGS